MIIVNPVQISYKRLAEVAARSRGQINRIYLHWTAGHYDDVYDDYHINIGAGGELYITCEEPCAALRGQAPSAEAKRILEKNRRRSCKLKRWPRLWRF